MTNEEQSICNHLASMPDHAHSTLKLVTLQNIMLATGGQIMGRGKLYDIRSKRMCPGVYKISLELCA